MRPALWGGAVLLLLLAILVLYRSITGLQGRSVGSLDEGRPEDVPRDQHVQPEGYSTR